MNNNNSSSSPQDSAGGLSSEIGDLTISEDEVEVEPRLPPVPEPVIRVPTIAPRPEAVRLDLRTRIEKKGTWFLQNLSLSSRYYARVPGERQFQSAGSDNDQVDMLLVINDASRYTRAELLREIEQQLDRTREYSRDRVIEGRTGIWRRLHTNPAGRRHLMDFDVLIEELRRLDGEMHTNDQSNAANEIFASMLEAHDWDPETIRDSGLGSELMHYAAFYFLGRLRYLRDESRRNPDWATELHNPVQQGADVQIDDFISNHGITTVVWEFSTRLHAPNLRADVRTVEWFANWAHLFHRNDSHGWETVPQLNTDMMDFAFERNYCFSHTLGALLGKSALATSALRGKPHPS
ncbi:hypothetical protein F5Y05DRAFT_43554 [Hypoxylon sp. FL0543]|nr:hypothetical protein F5Y05DRAFT_43554 [Hypoxylon sp. FL0543]